MSKPPKPPQANKPKLASVPPPPPPQLHGPGSVAPRKLMERAEIEKLRPHFEGVLKRIWPETPDTAFKRQGDTLLGSQYFDGNVTVAFAAFLEGVELGRGAVAPELVITGSGTVELRVPD